MTPIDRKLQKRRQMLLRSICLGAIFLFGQNTAIRASESVRFEDLDGDRCFTFSLLVPHHIVDGRDVALPFELVIDNDRDYKKLFSHKILRAGCFGTDLASSIVNVDFSKQTVLGLWTSVTCADVGFERMVIRDDVHKTLVYTVTAVPGNSSCMRQGPQSLNLIAVPKMPTDYRVIFRRLQK